MAGSNPKARLQCSELDPSTERHAYLRDYKKKRVGKWTPDLYPLYDLAMLQVLLIILGRGREAFNLALAMVPLVPKKEIPLDSAAEVMAYEVVREEVVSLGIYAADMENERAVSQILLASWGDAPFGWRARTKPKEITRYYQVMFSDEDTAFEHWEESRGDAAAEHLSTVCRYWLWLATDKVIMTHSLPGITLLRQAGITDTVVSEKMATCQLGIESLLELKRRETSLV